MTGVAVHVGHALLVTMLLATPPRDAGEHLVAGAQAFRQGRYAAALVEFRVARSLGAEDAGPYAAATLVKLGRPEEAVELFGDSGEGRDALLDYYHAIACYEARLYTCADRLLLSVGERAGPLIGAHAAKIRAAIATELSGEPPAATIDWYLARCDARGRSGHKVLAVGLCREAVALAERRGDRHRLAEASAQLASFGGPARPGNGR